jgi:hypothetical protein
MLVLDPCSAYYKLGDSPGYTVCTNYGWNDDYMIPDADSSISTSVAHESGSERIPLSLLRGKRANGEHYSSLRIGDSPQFTAKSFNFMVCFSSFMNLFADMIVFSARGHTAEHTKGDSIIINLTKMSSDKKQIDEVYLLS